MSGTWGCAVMAFLLMVVFDGFPDSSTLRFLSDGAGEVSSAASLPFRFSPGDRPAFIPPALRSLAF
jgi:hypothetical protein